MIWAFAERFGKWPWEVEEMVPQSLMQEFDALLRIEANEAKAG